MKTYLRYVPAERFGVVVSARSHVLCRGEGVVAAACQDVVSWNMRAVKKELCLEIDTQCEITALASLDLLLAAGRTDGTINVWSDGVLKVTLNGHKGAVQCLCFDDAGDRLASGSDDTDIIVWDMVAETGLFRLRGHKDQVTDLRFSGAESLVSSSKDMLVKVWDLETQHCAETVVGHRSAVWSFDIDPREGSRLVTGSSDGLLRVWRAVDEQEAAAEVAASGEDPILVPPQHDAMEVELGSQKRRGDAVSITSALRLAGQKWKLMGSLARQTNDRAARVRYSSDGGLLGCQSAGKVLEVYRRRTLDEVKRKVKRRLRRQREKQQKQPNARSSSDGAEGTKTSDVDEDGPTATDEFELVGVLRTKERISSFSFGVRRYDGDDENETENGTRESRAGHVAVVVAFNSNLLRQYSLRLPAPGGSAKKRRAAEGEGGDVAAASAVSTRFSCEHSIELPGHRSDVRSLALSSDESTVLTAASGECKLWSLRSTQCIRTMRCGYALCCAFLPGDLHAVVGTKAGKLLLLQLSDGSRLSSLEAHDGKALWSVDVRPDQRGLMTGGADKAIKFWDFGLKRSDSAPAGAGRSERRQLELVHVRTLKMTDDVLCVRYSHHRGANIDRLMVVVALLDCTVKVFYDDSLKFAFSLYGHKLPVLSMDVSDDNALLVTASADKNVKVWGMDFGDCHKSFFAHDDSVMAVKFVPRTHYFFSAGKDQRVRYWDADRFKLVLTLERHVGEVWALAVSRDGGFVLSAGHDRAVRRWVRTDEPVFLEEEREKELEAIFDSKLDNPTGGDVTKTGTLSIEAVAEHARGDGDAVDTAAAGKRSKETVKAGERLIDAVEVGDADLEKLKRYDAEVEAAEAALTEAERFERATTAARGVAPKPLVARPKPNVVMLGRSPVGHVAHTLAAIKPQELDEALMVLPFAFAPRVLWYCNEMLRLGSRPELASRTATYLLKVHFKQIVATGTLKPLLVELRTNMRGRLRGIRDVMGVNLAGLRFMLRQHEDEIIF